VSNPLRELLGWLLLGAVFLLVMRGYVRRWRARKRACWAPLAQVVNGTARGLRLTGSYEAHEVIAEMGPVSDAGPRSPNRSAWCFTTSLDPVAGRDRRQRRRTVLQSEGVDWTARYGYELPLVAEGRPGWHVTSSSEQLRQKLIGGAILDRVEQWDSYPEIGYSARFKLISVTDDDPDRMTPDRFRSRLDLLVSLARQTGLVVLIVGVAILAGACRRGASSNGSSNRGSTGPARAAGSNCLSWRASGQARRQLGARPSPGDGR
jgi:hypothetical protein